MKTFIILYRKGTSGPILGWFGEFENEDAVLEEFPFPCASTQVLQVIEASSKTFNDLLESSQEPRDPMSGVEDYESSDKAWDITTLVPEARESARLTAWLDSQP
jgi:hypothetical protein